MKECDRFGPIAPQSPGLIELSLGGEPDEHSEDCLTLNVWTPAPDGARRPVMVWVHGGSFVSGSGAGSLYRGGMLSREGDVVVVTINYRLGLLGFLAHPVFEESGQTWLGGEEWSGFGNWGLADQVAALHWVRDHIADFGGDPGNVTLFGESAGGMSVSALLATPAARGLFQRAIVQSGPPYTYTAERASARAEQVAAHLGVPLTREALEQVPAAALVRAAAEVGMDVAANDDPALLMMPVVDGGLLPVAPEAAVADGSASHVPLLIGTTRDESAFFTVGNTALSTLDEDGLRRWTRRLTPEAEAADDLIASVRAARAGRGEAVNPRDLWVAIATEYVFRLPTIRLADAHAGAARPGVGHLLLPVHLGVAGLRRDPGIVPRPGHPVRVRDGPQSGRADVFGWWRRRLGPVRHRAGRMDRPSPGPVHREAGRSGTIWPGRPGCSGRGPGAGRWNTRSGGRGTRSWRRWPPSCRGAPYHHGDVAQSAEAGRLNRLQ